MRILITGSRDWNDKNKIFNVLYDAGHNKTDVTLVSGACPTGADFLCEHYAREFGWIVERHPADWIQYGNRAGYVRNAEMVTLGADLCLAFIRNNSPGATMCSGLAIKAGIWTDIYMDHTPVGVVRTEAK